MSQQKRRQAQLAPTLHLEHDYKPRQRKDHCLGIKRRALVYHPTASSPHTQFIQASTVVSGTNEYPRRKGSVQIGVPRQLTIVDRQAPPRVHLRSPPRRSVSRWSLSLRLQPTISKHGVERIAERKPSTCERPYKNQRSEFHTEMTDARHHQHCWDGPQSRRDRDGPLRFWFPKKTLWHELMDSENADHIDPGGSYGHAGVPRWCMDRKDTGNTTRGRRGDKRNGISRARDTRAW